MVYEFVSALWFLMLLSSGTWCYCTFYDKLNLRKSNGAIDSIVRAE
jgi:hypothetical protein